MTARDPEINPATNYAEMNTNEINITIISLQ